MRWRAWLPRLTLFGLVACSSTGSACAWCKDVGMLCAAFGSLCVQYEVEMHEIDERKKACGTCGGGQTCNIVEEPPKCTPDPGAEGTACGTFKGDKRAYGCAKDLFCDRSHEPWRCHSLAKVGEACLDESSCIEGLGCAWERHVCIEPHV